MKYFLYIFYRYYKSSRYESLPYISTLTLFVLSLGFYLLSVYLFIFPDTELPDKTTFVIWALSVWVIPCFLIGYFIREKDLQNPEFEKRYDSSHGLLALIFVIFGFLSLITAIFYRGAFEENALQQWQNRPTDEVRFKPLEPENNEDMPTIDQSELREMEPDTVK